MDGGSEPSPHFLRGGLADRSLMLSCSRFRPATGDMGLRQAGELLVGVDERKAKLIALVPIGQVDEAILSVIGEGLKETFGRACVIAVPLPQPDYAHDRRRGQYRSDDILVRLRRPCLPAERWLGAKESPRIRGSRSPTCYGGVSSPRFRGQTAPSG
jgi:hypothetical protein